MESSVGAFDMVPLTTPSHWAAFHDIRRTVLFEARGRVDVYDEHHPDDRAATNHPFLLIANGIAVAAVRVDLGAEPGAAVFRLLAVRAPMQRQGYGRALMQLAESFAKREGCHLFIAYVAPNAIEFWTKLGYRMASKQSPGTDPRMEKRSHEELER